MWQAPPAPANAVAAQEEGLPLTYVASASDEAAADAEDGKRRRTLGAVKDPFEPAEVPKPKKRKKQAAEKAKSEDATGLVACRIDEKAIEAPKKSTSAHSSVLRSIRPHPRD